MAITRERKEELVALYTDLLGGSTGIVVTEYHNLSVAQVQDLRGKLREVNGRYLITKNTLFRIALNNAGWPVPDELLLGPVGVAFGRDNFPAVAKALLGYIKDNADFVSVKGGVMTGQLLSAAQVDAVSSLPSMDEMRAQLAGLIVQPAAGLVSVINAGVASVAQVLQAYVSKQEGNAA